MGFVAKKGTVKLERALSKLGFASRTEAQKLILEGRVRVLGQVVKNPHYLVNPEKTKIEVDGKPVKKAQIRVILLHKPRGLVSTRSDERGRKTVYDVSPPVPRELMPVGRLDQASSGLLLFTNDTRFSDFLCDPKNKIIKIYSVLVRGEFTTEMKEKLETGFFDRGEKLKAHSVEIKKVSKKESHLLVSLTEGKNREIRRMIEVVKSEVLKLKRVQFGEIKLGTLPEGKWRELSNLEIKSLKD